MKTADSQNICWCWYQFSFGALNLALATPAIYLAIGLPLIMRQHGWSGTEIGVFQLMGFPALFKIIMAWPVENRHDIAVTKHYVRWATLLGSAYLLVLLALAMSGIDANRWQLFTLGLLASGLSAWADIPVNALAIYLLPPEERIRAGGIRSAALCLAAILGGGLMLLAQQNWGWHAPFIFMASLLFAALWLLSTLRKTGKTAKTEHLALVPETAWLATWRDFFRQPGAWRWTLLLLGYFPFVATGWVYLKPLLLDYGFAAKEVAWIAGVGGGGCAALASLATARLVNHSTLGRAVPLCAFAGFATLVFLAAAIWHHADHRVMIVTSLLLAASMGTTASLAFSLMMEFARVRHQAVDYGLQASLFTLGRLTMPPIAGFILDRFNYVGMLAALALGALIMAMFSYIAPLILDRHKTE